MNLLSILLQQSEGGGMNSMLLMFAIIIVFYFFMIRPQMKKQKEVKKFRESLDKGVEVVTMGGIYGKVKEIKDNIIILEIADDVKIKVDRSAVAQKPEDLQMKK